MTVFDSFICFFTFFVKLYSLYSCKFYLSARCLNYWKIFKHDILGALLTIRISLSLKTFSSLSDAVIMTRAIYPKGAKIPITPTWLTLK